MGAGTDIGSQLNLHAHDLIYLETQSLHPLFVILPASVCTFARAERTELLPLMILDAISAL